jgi:hypothetical protein
LVENHSKTCVHTGNLTKMAANAAKMLPEASTRLHKSSPGAPKRSKGPQEAPIWLHEACKTTFVDPNPKFPTRHSQFAAHTRTNDLHEALKTLVSTPMQNSQLIIRSLSFTEHSLHLTYISFASHGCNFSRFATRCPHFTVNCSSFTVRSLLFIFTIVVHNSPFTLCPAPPTVHSSFDD